MANMKRKKQYDMNRGKGQSQRSDDNGKRSDRGADGVSRAKANGRKPPYRGKSSQTGSKDDRREEEIADTAAAMSRTNDVSWYIKYSQFAKDAANFPFALPTGEFLDFTVSGYHFKWATPGIMRLTFSPAYGISKDFTSPLNRSSIQFWTYLRSVQRAFSNYDHQDITMMVISIDNAMMYHSMLRRAYGVLKNVTPLNEYYPRALLAAMGMQFDDLKNHIADLRAYINEFAYLLEQYALPKGISLFDRHRWMCEGLYVDSQSSRAQTFMFMPKGFWQYDNTVATGSQMVWKQWIPDGASVNQHTFEQITQFGNELINSMSNDEDFATISGDLYVFYGNDTYQVPFTEEMYQILPVYDETVLSQIENATIMGNFVGTPAITQNPSVNAGAIIYNPRIGVVNGVENGTHMNFHWDSPTPDQVMEASRLISVVDPSSYDATDGSVSLLTCGTEILHQVDIFTRNPLTGGFRFNPVTGRVAVIKSSSTEADILNMAADALLMQNFDWAPLMAILRQPGETTTPTLVGLTWDVDNVTEVPDKYMENLNLAATMSLFTVQQ